MKQNLSLLSAGLLFTGLTANTHAVQLLLEDFEDGATAYSLTQGADFNTNTPATETGDGGGDYFGRIGGSGGLTISETYNGADGGFFAIQDMDASGTGDPNIISDIAYMTWTGIDITTHTSFSLSIFLAENRPGGTTGWDADMSFKIEYQIDGGGYLDLLAVATSDPAFNNRAAAIDANFDGTGEGAIINDTFAQHSANFSGTGSNLDLRVTMVNFTGTSEDIAFDNVTLVTVPEPSSAILGALGLLPLLCRRKRG